MITIAFVADLHMANHRQHGGVWTGGLNVRGQETIHAFGNALSLAEAHGAERMVLLGDVFDTVKPEPQIIAEAQRMVNSHITPVRVIKGNHDEASSEAGDHALGPLHETANTRVYEAPDVEVLAVGRTTVEMHYLPFETGPATDWLPKRLDDMGLRHGSGKPGVVRLLAIHLGLHDQEMRKSPTAFWFEKSNDAISAEYLAAECYKRGIHAVFAGNWHGRRTMEFAFPVDPKTGLQAVTLVQVGALTPTGWDNAGLTGYGGVAIAKIDEAGKLDLEFGEVEGPRFVNVRSLDELARAVTDAGGNRLYVRWHAKPTEVAHAREELDRYKVPGSCLVASDIAIDKEETQTLAREAAEAAQSTTTMQAVLEAFVAKKPMPETVSRTNVYNRCRDYLI